MQKAIEILDKFEPSAAGHFADSFADVEAFERCPGHLSIPHVECLGVDRDLDVRAFVAHCLDVDAQDVFVWNESTTDDSFVDHFAVRVGLMVVYGMFCVPDYCDDEADGALFVAAYPANDEPEAASLFSERAMECCSSVFRGIRALKYDLDRTDVLSPALRESLVPRLHKEALLALFPECEGDQEQLVSAVRGLLADAA